MYNIYEAGHSFEECSCFGCDVVMESHRRKDVPVKSYFMKLGKNNVGYLSHPYGTVLVSGKDKAKVILATNLYKNSVLSQMQKPKQK